MCYRHTCTLLLCIEDVTAIHDVYIYYYYIDTIDIVHYILFLKIFLEVV